MTAQPLVVIGGGEHARVVIEAARTRADLWTIAGFVDPLPCDETTRRLGVPRLGDDESALARVGSHVFVLGMGTIGTGDARKRIVDRYLTAGAGFATIVHAHAWVSPTATVATGSVVFAGCVVQSGAQLGIHSVVNTSCVVEHDVTIGDFAQLAPGVVVGGGTRIGAHSYVGLGARVRDHVTVGTRVLIAMGAVVTNDVSDGTAVYGIPARAR